MARMARTRTARDTNDYVAPADEESDEPTHGRGRSRDTSSDSRPARGSSRSAVEQKKTTPPKAKGWKGYDEMKTKQGDFPDDFKLSSEVKIVKFLDDEPLVTYHQHWVDEIKEGKRSFNCLGEDCPLDEYGHKARSMAVFNVVDMSVDPPAVKTLTTGPMLSDILKNLSEEKATSPLNRDDLYWAMSQKRGSGKGNKTTYNVQAIKGRDLAEDWDGLAPLSEEELQEYEQDMFDDDIVHYDTRDKLREIAEEYLA
jgi:hypothetical protein